MIPNSFPDPFPKSAIPGATKPIIINGIEKLRNPPNRPENVFKALTTWYMPKVSDITPIKIPNIIPKTNLVKRPNFFILLPP